MDQPIAPAQPRASATQTKAFSLVSEDVAAIEVVKQEEKLLSDSAALRLLIREGRKYRELRRQAEQEVFQRLIRGEISKGS